MRIIASEQDFLNVTEELLYGCNFRAKVYTNGGLGFTFGCYRLLNPQTGFGKVLQEILSICNESTLLLYSRNLKPHNLEIDFNIEELKLKLLARPPCRRCLSPLVGRRA